MTPRDTPLPRPRISQSTIAAAFASALLDLAVSKGACRDDLVRVSGIDPEALLGRDARIPMSQWLALMRRAKEMTGDAALALHYGEAFDIADMSVLGLMGRSVETKLEGFEMLNRFSRLICDVETADGVRFKLVDDAAGTWLVDTRLNPAETPEISECGFAQMASMGRRMLPGMRHFQAVHFTHAAPPYLAEYQRIFEAPVVFESDRNALLMPKGWQSDRIALQPHYALEILGSHAETLLERLDQDSSFRCRVEEVIIGSLPRRRPTSAWVAAKLGLTTKTLYRKLKAEDLTFEQLLNDVCRKFATHYLRDQGLSAKETAFQLGFSDPAAFSRAFKRWTGVSPSRFVGN